MNVPTQRTTSPTQPHWTAAVPSLAPSTGARAGAAAVRDLRAVATAQTDRFLAMTRRFVPTVMTVSLALVFLWFGALKVAGSSPVTALVSATLPWFDPDALMRVLGAVEVVLAAGLLLGRARRMLLVVLAAHLAGTFLSFVMAPELMFQDGNPLLLTVAGEFVLKNLVLVTAALHLAGHHPAATADRAGAQAV